MLGVMRVCSRRSVHWLICGAVLLLGAASTVRAQPPAAPEAAPAEPPAEPRQLTDDELLARRHEMDQQAEKLLQDLELFFKTTTDANGLKIFTVIWEENGQQSKLTVNVKKTGTYRFEPLFVVYAYTPVVSLPDGQKLPAEVIDAACAASDELVMGSYSISGKRDAVFANGSAFLNNMTVGEMWMCLAQVHQNRIDLEQTIGPLLSKDK